MVNVLTSSLWPEHIFAWQSDDLQKVSHKYTKKRTCASTFMISSMTMDIDRCGFSRLDQLVWLLQRIILYIYVCIYTSSFRTTFARVEQLELGSIRTHRIWRSHLHFPWRNDKDVISCSKRNHLRYKKKQRKLISLHYKQQHWQCDCSSLEGTQSLDTFCMQILQTQGFLGAFQLGDIGARGIPWKHCLT
jgi:hypothetical protein